MSTHQATAHETPKSDPTQDIKRLAAELEKLNSHNFIRIHNSVYRLVGFQFLRGLAFGLGTVVGASALVSVVVLLLSQVEVIPVIGNLATQIIQEIDEAPEP